MRRGSEGSPIGSPAGKGLHNGDPMKGHVKECDPRGENADIGEVQGIVEAQRLVGASPREKTERKSATQQRGKDRENCEALVKGKLGMRKKQDCDLGGSR